MAADAIQFYDAFKKNIASGLIDLDSHTFKLALVTSSYSFNAAHAEYADITNELPTGLGYTAGGATLTSVTWNQSAGVAAFDAADVSWTASGGSLVFRRGILYDDTASGKPLVGAILFNNTPADVTVTDGNTFYVQWNSTGVFTLS